MHFEDLPIDADALLALEPEEVGAICCSPGTSRFRLSTKFCTMSVVLIGMGDPRFSQTDRSSP